MDVCANSRPVNRSSQSMATKHDEALEVVLDTVWAGSVTRLLNDNGHTGPLLAHDAGSPEATLCS